MINGAKVFTEIRSMLDERGEKKNGRLDFGKRDYGSGNSDCVTSEKAKKEWKKWLRMKWLRRLCRNLSDGQKRSELTVETGREYNRSQEILPEEFTDIFRNNTCIRKEESG